MLFTILVEKVVWANVTLFPVQINTQLVVKGGHIAPQNEWTHVTPFAVQRNTSLQSRVGSVCPTLCLIRVHCLEV